jgi:co-chaperonin GroES (HSP10)|tara:strand:+ start:1502 stop:1876 length:375 start_codon:yes stop_codon:yes gene_type:complete
MSDNTVIDLEQKRKASQLPEPCGYNLLIALPQTEKKTDGGVYIPDDVSDREGTACITGMILKMGPDAYTDKDRFPSGPYCKEGDWIVMQAYTGTRILIHGQELRLINDDSVRAVTEDPRGIKRA